MKFFVLLLAAVIAAMTVGSRLPVVALSKVNKAKVDNKEVVVMKLRGGGMAIGPLNAGNMIDVSSGFLAAYGLQLLFAKKMINGRFFPDGLGHPTVISLQNVLGFNLLSTAAIGYFVNRETPAFKGILGKIGAITWLANSLYYATLKFVPGMNTPCVVSDAGITEGMIVCGVIGLANLAIFV